jgi:O-methyltransferase
MKAKRTGSWKRLAPPGVRRLYRKGRLGVQLLRELDMSSAGSFVQSLRLSRTILAAKPNSLIAVPWLKALDRRARELDRNGIPGDFVECGVYRGGSAAVLGAALGRSRLPRKLWLFDSFQGLPGPTEVDGPSAPPLAGDLVGDQRSVWQLLRKVGTPMDRVRIVPGWFHETLPGETIDRVALLHIDADWYESVKLCLERFFDRVEAGGIIITDDYDCWPGAKFAVDEFARGRALQPLRNGASEAACFRKRAGTG